MTYRQAILKRRAESILIFPIIFLGKIGYHFFSKKGFYDLVMFCPSADIGGANRVNADICKCFPEKKILVIFSKKPANNGFLILFKQPNVTIIDLHKKIDVKWFHFINIYYRSKLAAWINTMPRLTVIGGESIYFYKVLPYLKKNIKKIELTHVNKWLNYTQAFITMMDTRIFSTQNLLQEAATFYSNNQLPLNWQKKLIHIDNSIAIHAYHPMAAGTLQILFVGRGAPQKRVPLVVAIAKELHSQQSDVHFSFAGDVSTVVHTEDFPFCTFYGNVSGDELKKIYQQSHVLILTSAFEGLPLAVMEMMAYGKVVISTAVNAIPDYIKDGHTGFLLPAEPDKDIINQAVSKIKYLSENRELLNKTGSAGRAYAIEHFSVEKFCNEYRKVLFD